MELGPTPPRVYLLSPANTGGERGRMLLREQATFDLAVRLRQTGATIGEIYSFISGLYFRGKLTYAEAFPAPPQTVPGTLVISPGAGLLPASFTIQIQHLIAMAAVDVDAANPGFRDPLIRDAQSVRNLTPPDTQFILLSSVATKKYVEPLLEIFGHNLVFPAEFAGRGDMSRGGLLLRAARSGTELAYAPVATAARRGPRPPKLPRLKG